MPQASTPTPAFERLWHQLARAADPRLVTQDDWPALEQLMQDAHDRGHDVPAATRLLTDSGPLGSQPAQELRYRLVGHLDLETTTPPIVTRRVPAEAAAKKHQAPHRPAPPRPAPRR